MQHTQPHLEREPLKQEPLEREPQQFERLRAIEVCDLSAQIAQLRLRLNELVGNLTPEARDNLKVLLVSYTEQAQRLREAS